MKPRLDRIAGDVRQALAGGYFVLAVLVCGRAEAATCYVSTTGSDTNSGTLARPFRTLGKGVSVLRPGDTLYARAGTYVESLINRIPGGTAAAPVTVAAYPGESVTIKGPAGVLDVIQTSSTSRSHIVLDGFTIDASSVQQNGIKITYTTLSDSAHHIRVKNCEVKNAPSQGILVSGPLAHGNEFINVDVHHNGTNTYGHGFYIETDNNLFDDCRIHNNAGHGIQVYSDYANKPGQYRPDNNVVRNCRIWGNGTRGLGLYAGDGNCGFNNTIWSNSVGGVVISSPNGKFFNNTLYKNNTESALRVVSPGPVQTSGVQIRNNLLHANSSGIEIESSAVATVVTHNLSSHNGSSNYSNGSGSTFTSNNRFGNAYDPGFVNALALDFRLLSSSAAVDQGIKLAETANDAAGFVRPKGAAYDIGAFEYTPRGQVAPRPRR